MEILALLMFIGGALLLLLAYFLPTIIAIFRHHPNSAPIILVNFFLGWTGIGWIVALVWSFMAAHSTIVIQQDRRY